MGQRNVSENVGFRLDNFHSDRELKKGAAKGLVNLYPGITCSPAEAIVEMNARIGIGSVTVNNNNENMSSAAEQISEITYDGNVLRSSIFHNTKRSRFIAELESLSLGLVCKNQIVFTNIDDGVEDFVFDIYNKDPIFKFLKIYSLHNNLYVYGDDDYYKDIDTKEKIRMPFCISDKYFFRNNPAVWKRDIYPLSIKANVLATQSLPSDTDTDINGNLETGKAVKYRFQYVQLGKEDRGDTDSLIGDENADFLFDDRGDPHPNFAYITPVTQAFPEYPDIQVSPELEYGNNLVLLSRNNLTEDIHNQRALISQLELGQSLSKQDMCFKNKLEDDENTDIKRMDFYDAYVTDNILNFDTAFNRDDFEDGQIVRANKYIKSGEINGFICAFRQITAVSQPNVNHVYANSINYRYVFEIYVIDSDYNIVEPTVNAPVGVKHHKKVFGYLISDTINWTEHNHSSKSFECEIKGKWFEDIKLENFWQIRAHPYIEYQKDESNAIFYNVGISVNAAQRNFIRLNIYEKHKTRFHFGRRFPSHDPDYIPERTKAIADGATHIRVWRTDPVPQTADGWQDILNGRAYEYCCDIPIYGYWWQNSWRDLKNSVWTDNVPFERTEFGQLNTLNTNYQPFPENVKNAVNAFGRLWVNSQTEGAWYYSEINGGDGNNSSTAHPEYYNTLFDILNYYIQIPNNTKYGKDTAACEFNGDMFFFKEYGMFILRGGDHLNKIEPISENIGCVYPNTLKAIDVVGRGKLLVFMSARGFMFMDTSYSTSAFEAFTVKEICYNGYLARAYDTIKGYSQLNEQVYVAFANNILVVSITDFSNFGLRDKEQTKSARFINNALFCCFRFLDDEHTGAFTYCRLDDETMEKYLRGEWNIEIAPDKQNAGQGIPVFDLENQLFCSYLVKVIDNNSSNTLSRLVIANLFSTLVFEDKFLKDKEILNV